MKRSAQKNQLRIIGGKWRGRKLPFPDIEGLRPTPDRVRETLFNWLNNIIDDAYCLDLFAGSGALGFEALSRGAAKAVFIDTSREITDQLKNNQQKLQAENIEIICTKAENYIAQTKESFDVVFLDPPFHQNLIPHFCELLEKYKIIKPGGYIYLEAETTIEKLKIPNNWKVLKQKKAGRVYFYLMRVSDIEF